MPLPPPPRCSARPPCSCSQRQQRWLLLQPQRRDMSQAQSTQSMCRTYTKRWGTAATGGAALLPSPLLLAQGAALCLVPNHGPRSVLHCRSSKMVRCQAPDCAGLPLARSLPAAAPLPGVQRCAPLLPPLPTPAPDLKKCMHAIFGQFGTVLEVVTRRTYRLRGQAWVVFEKAEDARKAMELMAGFPFFNKPIVSSPRGAMGVEVHRGRAVDPEAARAAAAPAGGWAWGRAETYCRAARTLPQRIALAKTKSDAVAKADGSFRWAG